MVFDRPLWLLLLLFGLIVLWLHRRVSGSAPVVVTAPFLLPHQDAPESLMRRQRRKNNLLLLVRLLFVVLVSLAAAAPSCRSDQDLLVLVFDSSATMAARDGAGGRSRTEEAIGEAERMLAELEPGRVALVLATPHGGRVLSPPSRAAVALRRLADLEAGLGQADIADAVAMARRLVREAGSGRVRLLTDGGRQVDRNRAIRDLSFWPAQDRSLEGLFWFRLTNTGEEAWNGQVRLEVAGQQVEGGDPLVQVPAAHGGRIGEVEVEIPYRGRGASVARVSIVDAKDTFPLDDSVVTVVPYLGPIAVQSPRDGGKELIRALSSVPRLNLAGEGPGDGEVAAEKGHPSATANIDHVAGAAEAERQMVVHIKNFPANATTPTSASVGDPEILSWVGSDKSSDRFHRALASHLMRPVRVVLGPFPGEGMHQGMGLHWMGPKVTALAAGTTRTLADMAGMKALVEGGEVIANTALKVPADARVILRGGRQGLPVVWTLPSVRFGSEGEGSLTVVGFDPSIRLGGDPMHAVFWQDLVTDLLLPPLAGCLPMEPGDDRRLTPGVHLLGDTCLIVRLELEQEGFSGYTDHSGGGGQGAKLHRRQRPQVDEDAPSSSSAVLASRWVDGGLPSGEGTKSLGAALILLALGFLVAERLLQRMGRAC